MILRKLKIKDAPFMLEWMLDPEVAKNFRTDFSQMTIEKAEAFILSAQNFESTRNYAIVNQEDEYLGTISLKNIDFENKNAEYAVSLRKKAQGTSVASDATNALFDIAFNELDLHRVYLNVLDENIRANKFYLKIGFVYEGQSKDCLRIDGEFKSLNWYAKIRG